MEALEGPTLCREERSRQIGGFQPTSPSGNIGRLVCDPRTLQIQQCRDPGTPTSTGADTCVWLDQVIENRSE